MKVSGTSVLQSPREQVWRALNDPAVLVRSIPGCQRLEALGADQYKMTLAAGVGSIKGVYDGEVRLSDHQEPGSFRMEAQGAGAPGTIGAAVRVTLAEAAGGGTEVSYDADAVVGGMIGGVGQRMLTGVSKRMAAEFFGNVDALLTGAGTASEGGRTAGAGATVDGSGGRPSEARPDGFGAPGSGGRPTPGQVFTAPPAAARPGPGFVEGVVAGAAAALVGALVGAWIRGRR